MNDRKKRISSCVKRIWQRKFNGYYPGEVENEAAHQKIIEPLCLPENFGVLGQKIIAEDVSRNTEREESTDVPSQQPHESLDVNIIQSTNHEQKRQDDDTEESKQEGKHIFHDELFAALDTPNFYDLASQHYGINKFNLTEKHKQNFNHLMKSIVRLNEVVFASSAGEFELPNFDFSQASPGVWDFVRNDRMKRNLPECPLVAKYGKPEVTS